MHNFTPHYVIMENGLLHNHVQVSLDLLLNTLQKLSVVMCSHAVT